MTMNMDNNNDHKNIPRLPNELLLLIFAQVDDLITFAACACVSIHWRSVLMGQLWNRRVKKFRSSNWWIHKNQLDTLEKILSGKDTYELNVDVHLMALLLRVGNCNLKFLKVSCNNDTLFHAIRLNKNTLENLQIGCMISPHRITEFLNIVSQSRITNIIIHGPLEVFWFVRKGEYKQESLQFPVLESFHISQLSAPKYHKMNFMKFILERSPRLKTLIVEHKLSWPDQGDINTIQAFMPTSLLETCSVYANTHKQICFRKK